MKRITNKLIKSFQQRGLTLALGESMTCGLAAHQLCTVKGTMDVLKGSIVCYQPSAKTESLNIPPSLIKKYTAESPQVTEAFAKKLSKLVAADVYAAITGLAAPKADGSTSKGKPVGTVFFAVVFKKKIYSCKSLFRGTPSEIRLKACKELYAIILKVVIAQK